MMTEKRKVVLRKDKEIRRIDARETVKLADLSTSERREAEKDIHLLEAALSGDLVVISRDASARRVFRKVFQDNSRIRRVMWLNPVSDATETDVWLAEGAKRVPEFTLGFGQQ